MELPLEIQRVGAFVFIEAQTVLPAAPPRWCTRPDHRSVDIADVGVRSVDELIVHDRVVVADETTTGDARREAGSRRVLMSSGWLALMALQQLGPLRPHIAELEQPVWS